MQTSLHGAESEAPRTLSLSKEDLKILPDSVIRWMARHAKGDDLAVVGAVLSDRVFGTH
jgi:hypothetical protein